MIYGKRWTKKFKKTRYCSDCDKPIDGPAWRLYGCSEVGEQPWTIYLHDECIQLTTTRMMIAGAKAT